MRLGIGIVIGRVACGLVASVVFFPVFEEVKISAPASACLSNLKQQGLSLLVYAADENDRFPLRDAWMDATLPYAKTERVWHCPSVPKAAYGYAFNAALSGGKGPQEPSSTPLTYESVDPIRNASDPFASFLPEGRHEGSTSRNLAYADGHAKGVP